MNVLTLQKKKHEMKNFPVSPLFVFTIIKLNFLCDVFFFCCCCVYLQTQIFKIADKQYEGEFCLLWKEAIWLIKTRTSTMCTLLDLTKIWKETMRRRECCSIKGNNLIYISLYYSAIHQHMVFSTHFISKKFKRRSRG